MALNLLPTGTVVAVASPSELLQGHPQLQPMFAQYAHGTEQAMHSTAQHEHETAQRALEAAQHTRQAEQRPRLASASAPPHPPSDQQTRLASASAPSLPPPHISQPHPMAAFSVLIGLLRQHTDTKHAESFPSCLQRVLLLLPHLELHDAAWLLSVAVAAGAGCLPPQQFSQLLGPDSALAHAALQHVQCDLEEAASRRLPQKGQELVAGQLGKKHWPTLTAISLLKV